MSDASDARSFLAGVPRLTRFAEVADTGRYRPVPAGWVVGLADVVGSTVAIEAGRYKAVNVAGAAVISAVSNALGHGAFPFVFGGDGASFAVPPDWAREAAAALAATATMAREELELELRIGLVPVEAIRAAGHDLTLARFEASPNVAYAMFAGGGLSWCEEALKRGDFALDPAPPGARPDLTGLSCRFSEIPAERGVILSCIVRQAPGAAAAAYQGVLEQVVALVERSPDRARPIPAAGPPLGWPPPTLSLEARFGRRPGQALWLRRARVGAQSLFAAAVIKLGLRLGRFDPARYMGELVQNSDYRKYDDGLRMTIDCAPSLADAIEARLAEAMRDGIVTYGLHRQAAALLTCFTPSVTRNDHIHFVDGAAGGYAAAASLLKAGDAS